VRSIRPPVRRKKESLFERALKSENKNPAFWLDLADLRLRDTKRSRQAISKSDWEKILVLVDRAARCDDKNPEILAKTADYYFACGDAASAAELYKTAHERQPSLTGLKEKLAACHSQMGDDAAAAGLLEGVVADNPMNLAAYDQLAAIRLRQNQLASALTSLRQALVIAPIDPGATRTSFVSRCAHGMRQRPSNMQARPRNASPTSRIHPAACDFLEPGEATCRRSHGL
jgi:tetratricopeptide (TPR) repeat protein